MAVPLLHPLIRGDGQEEPEDIPVDGQQKEGDYGPHKDGAQNGAECAEKAGHRREMKQHKKEEQRRRHHRESGQPRGKV